MPIIRGKHSFDGQFTQIPNAWLRDKRLSYKARGLLAELMSHAPGFEVSRERLSRSGQDGDRAVRTAIAELESAGYLERSQSRSSTGQMGAAVWITKDPFAPSVQNAPAGNAPAGNATSKNKEDKKIEVKKGSYAQDELERLFDSFWQKYPRHVGKSKARQVFVKLLETGTDAQDLIAGAERLAADPNLPPMQYVPHATTWLNREGWNDDPYPERQLSIAERKFLAEEEAAQRAKLLRERQERERLEREAEDQRRREDLEKNPVTRCEHDRIIWVCPVCSPVLQRNKAE